MSTTLRIGNSKITIGRKYTLDAKPDPTAPKGFKDMTKTPFDGNVTADCVFFDPKQRRYDTCFYTESPILRNIVTDSAERQALVDSYIKHIKTPYEKTFNANLEPSESNEFWSNYRVEAYVNKEFDTENKGDLLNLFLLLWGGQVCEKDERNPLLRNDAAFILSSNESIKNKSKERTKTKMSAVTVFNTLVESDRDKLNLVLQWIDKEDPSKIDGEDLSSIYYEIFNSENGIQDAEKFLNAIKEYEEGPEKMEFFYAIKRLYEKRIIRKTGRGYVEDGSEVLLGNTLQDIAKLCLTEKSQQRQIITDLIEQHPFARREILNPHIKQTTKKGSK